MISASEALKRLQEGNKRFISGNRDLDKLANNSRRSNLASGQSPFAIILGCSDSRVPVEIIFDQGLGDLFVIRVAGNIATPSQLGSIEFAADNFHSPLIVVLGHSRCGAVSATLNELRHPSQKPSENLSSIINAIKPSVANLLEGDTQSSEEALIQQAVRANITGSVNQFCRSSALLKQLVQKNNLLIVGAEYALETGQVTFFDA
ncbi:MAG: carbonic anhydrase [Endozoicomonas sp. (ex Botrylloides leachii)]|nr:carbonic anhydrase [Endozoicomonas sp. (ex Botrylloides leachii)]